MKKEDIQRMMSQVDEKYISELTEAEFPSDVEYADEVSGEVEVVKHISHWRNWAAAAAALIVCVGLGAVLMRPAIQHSQFQVGDSAGCYDVLDSMSEEDFIPYFTEIDAQDSNLNYYHETALYEQYGDYLNDGEGEGIQGIKPPPVGEKWFGSAYQMAFNAVSNPNRTVKFNMTNIDFKNDGNGFHETETALIHIYDNPQIDMNTFTSLTPYHIDDYDIDFYGIYKNHDGNPVQNSTAGIFLYHNRLYILNLTDMSRKDTVELVYQILDYDSSAQRFYLEYAMSEEDFVPYFINTEDNEDDILGNLNGSEAFSERYGKFTTKVENVAPAVAKNCFDLIDIAFNDISYSDRKAELQMMNSGNDIAVIRVYDNPELPEELSQMTLYHLADYDIDFYGIYRSKDSEVSHCIFAYHDKLYEIYTDNFSRKETVKLAYEVLESDFSAESLYQQYCGDIVHMEDSRITTLEEANQLEFCKGMIPQLDVLTGENEQSNGRNLGMDGEYIYDNLYDDSDLQLNKDSIIYAQELNVEQLSYTYSNPECNLNILYTSFLPDNANLAEHYSPKITLQYPFSTPVDGQNENSRLRYWDFWLDLDTCYVHLDGHCSMNQEDAFINGLNHIIVGQQQEAYLLEDSLYLANALDFCKNLVPQMTEVSDMQLAVCNREEDAVRISYDNDEANKIFNITYYNYPADLMDFAVPVLTPDQLTEEEISKPEITYGFAVKCQKCTIVMNFSGCEKSELMPYLTELKNLIEKYDSETTDLQQFNQNELWGGLVPELQKIGSLEFQGISLASPDDADALNYQVLYQEQNNPEHKIAVTYSYGDNVQSIVSAKLGILDAVPVYGGDGNQRIFEFHAGKFFIEIETIGCTQEEIDTYLTETEKLLNKNYHASGAILEYLNQQEAFRNGIPEISQMNQLKFYSAVTNLTLDENAPEIEIHYVNEENPEQKLFCKFTKNPKTEATPLTIEEIDGNLQIEPGQYEHFELFVDCHGWYAWIVGENCYKEDLDCYTMALAETYKANH